MDVGDADAAAVDEAGEAVFARDDVGQAGIAMRYHQSLTFRPSRLNFAEEGCRGPAQPLLIEIGLVDEACIEPCFGGGNATVEPVIEGTAGRIQPVKPAECLREYCNASGRRLSGAGKVDALYRLHQQPMSAGMNLLCFDAWTEQSLPREPSQARRLVGQFAKGTCLFVFQDEARATVRLKQEYGRRRSAENRCLGRAWQTQVDPAGDCSPRPCAGKGLGGCCLA